jgi:hypothetical protein
MINTAIVIAFLAVSLICVVLVSGFINLSLSPKPIYYIPGATSAGYASPNAIPKGSVISFASSWLLNYLNFNKETIDTAYDRSRKLMAPKFLAENRHIMEKESQDVKDASIASIFSMTSDPSLIEKEGRLSIVVRGEHQLFMGKEAIKTVNMEYTITLMKVSPTEANPYGLLVRYLYKEEIGKDGAL